MTTKSWEILTLNHYLEEVRLPMGTTFTRVLPATDECPEITVGMGLIRLASGVTVVERVPLQGTRVTMINSFINTVAEKYLEYSQTAPDHWQELILLDLGHVEYATSNKNEYGNSSLSVYRTLCSIPKEERLPLLKEFGLQKIVTVVGLGFTTNLDGVLTDMNHVLTSLEELNSTLSEPARYDTLIQLMNAGVPLEDLEMAVQLPPEMVEGFYND